MVSREADIRRDSKHYQARLPLNLRSLSPFPDNFDPGALWGLRKMIRRGAIGSIKLYLFIVLLTLADVLFVGLNLITPARTRENVILRPFSPHAPPRFRDHPFIFSLCKLCLWLGPFAPQWVQEWSTWDGLLPNGYWPPVDRKIDFLCVSRSPCPGLNALANHSKFCMFPFGVRSLCPEKVNSISIRPWPFSFLSRNTLLQQESSTNRGKTSTSIELPLGLAELTTLAHL